MMQWSEGVVGWRGCWIVLCPASLRGASLGGAGAPSSESLCAKGPTRQEWVC